MIASFASNATEKLFSCERVPKFVNIEAVALRKLAMLNRAKRVEELRIPPSNHLETLKGNRASTTSSAFAFALTTVMRWTLKLWITTNQ
jgi:toxin HigB-1